MSKHSERCERAKPKSRCRCRCGGRYHGMLNESVKGNPNYDRVLNASIGGEAGELIEKLSGKEFTCTCRKKQVLGGFMGYLHDGGIVDKDGQKWWVYYHCENPKCNYDWSLWKVEKRVIDKI